MSACGAQERAYRDGRTRLERDRVHGIVRADDQRDVRVLEVVIDLVHFEHD